MTMDPTKIQGVLPQSQSVTARRLGVTRLLIPNVSKNDGSGGINWQTDTEFHFWWATPLPSLAVPININYRVPFLPILWTPLGGTPYENNVIVQLCQEDYDALAVYTGNVQYELLCSRDAGVTMETVATGIITIPNFLTRVWT